MKFSKRTNWPIEKNPLTLAVEALKKGAVPVLDLTESNPTRCLFQYLNHDRLKPFSNPVNLIYEPDPHGLIIAREAVCAYYAEKKIHVTPHQVFLTAGTSEAYGFLFRLLADSGETLLVPKPGYPLFDTLADIHDLRLKGYRLVYDREWRMPPEALKDSFEKNTKVLVVVNPNNPTGHFVTGEERENINRFCQENDLALISDEVFLDFGLKPTMNPGGLMNPRGSLKVSFAGNGEVLTFTLSGISKILGMPQMKLGWIVVSGPESLKKEAIQRLEIISDAFLSVNTPVQRALPEWMKLRQPIVKEISERAGQNQDTLVRQAVHSDVLPSEGGWYGVLRLADSADEEETALRLLERQKVLVHPGYLFDFDFPALVISLLLPPGSFQESIDRLFKGLL